MRTDPRAACANAEERKGWAVLHDLVCHPLMALTGWSSWSLRFHDWTSYRAWPRVQPEWLLQISHLQSRRHGVLVVREVAPRVWSVTHPTLEHTITVSAGDAVHALEQAEAWFDGLAEVGLHPWGKGDRPENWSDVSGWVVVDPVPVDPRSGKPYFAVRGEGWGTGWSAGVKVEAPRADAGPVADAQQTPRG